MVGLDVDAWDAAVIEHFDELGGEASDDTSTIPLLQLGFGDLGDSAIGVEAPSTQLVVARDASDDGAVVVAVVVNQQSNLFGAGLHGRTMHNILSYDNKRIARCGGSLPIRVRLEDCLLRVGIVIGC